MKFKLIAFMLVIGTVIGWATMELNSYGDSIGIPYFAVCVGMFLGIVAIVTIFVVNITILAVKGYKYEKLEEKYAKRIGKH